MAFLNGIFNTTFNPDALNKRSFAATILRLFPSGTAPLFALSSQIGKSTAISSTHGYTSKTMSFIATTSPAGNTDVATTIGVTTNVGMSVDMVLHNVRTRENMRITAIPAGTTTVTVERATGRVAAAAINAADKFLCAGTAFMEGSLRPAARQLQLTHVVNYTQIFRDAWGLTGTAAASQMEQNLNAQAENRKDCSMFHADSIEGAIIWGQPKMDVSGAHPRHYTQGVIDAMEQYAPANTNSAGATTNYSQLVTLMEPAFQYSTDMSNARRRVAFGDSTAIKVMNDIGRLSGQVQIAQNETTFGMNFTNFKFYKGEVTLIEHPGMNGRGLSGTLLIMDMPALKLAYMAGRDTKIEEYGMDGKVLPLGEDGIGGSFTSELAVELVNPYSCVLIEGLTAGSAT